MSKTIKSICVTLVMSLIPQIAPGSVFAAKMQSI